MSRERRRQNLLPPSSSRRRGKTERMWYIAGSDPPRRSSLIRGVEGADSEEEEGEENFEEQTEGDFHPLSSGETAQPSEQQWLVLGGLFGFLRRFSAGAHPSFAPSSSGTSLEHQLNTTIYFSNTPIQQVKEAKTFILSGERGKDSYPSISFDEIVLPGSEVQRAMAKQMQVEMDLMMEEHCGLEECVICMDGFTPDNPRMPTLCGCGENKTYFHLPCLYQWIDQGGRNCPSCRQRLVWEEF
jgi:hypothetical protein